MTAETPNEQTGVKAVLGNNGMTPERLAAILDRIHQRNQDPEYKALLEEERIAAEHYRQQVNDEARRQLDEEEGK